ncbi:MAG: hypothetical protein P8N76_08475 [Pirellulaceae bacterium]|nr:hypothetical protein [Pirellulaceae bacterium]
MSPWRKPTQFLIAVLLPTLLAATTMGATPRVYLEVLSDRGAAVNAPQQWLRMLRNLPLASIRLRQRRDGETFNVDRQGGEASRTIRVKAILGTDGVLRVPDHRFRLSDRQKMKQWIENLESSSDGNTITERVAFGMTGPQLDRVRRLLSTPVRIKTIDEPFSKFFQHIQSITTIPIRTGVATRIGDDKPIENELSGLSCGTALAAALQSKGLAWAPAVSPDGTLRVDIIDGRTAKQRWPVGWKTETPTRQMLPKLFESLSTEIVDTPLKDVLAAIQQRLGVPILIDHESIARKRIEPMKVKVAFPAKRTFYKRILDRVLFQAGLQAEIRNDDADRPFIWLTPL